MRMRILGALVGVTLLSLGAAYAREEAKVTQSGELLFTLKADEYGKTPQQRADGVYDRLRLILGNQRLKASDVRVVDLDTETSKIVANQVLIVQVGPAEATANNSSASKLAREWASHLQSVLPRIKARPDDPVSMAKPRPATRRPTPKPTRRPSRGR